MGKVIVIVKKENTMKGTSYKAIKEFRCKSLLCRLYILNWKLRGYEVQKIIEKGI